MINIVNLIIDIFFGRFVYHVSLSLAFLFVLATLCIHSHQLYLAAFVMLVFAIEFNIRILYPDLFIYVKCDSNEESSYDFEFPNLLQNTEPTTQVKLLVSIIWDNPNMYINEGQYDYCYRSSSKFDCFSTEI